MADYVEDELEKIGISISKPMLAVVCIVSGVMVILFPAVLVWIVGLFLVIQGVLLWADHYEQERRTSQLTRSKHVYCPNCRARNTEEAIFCKRCGRKLLQTEEVVTEQLEEAVQ